MISQIPYLSREIAQEDVVTGDAFVRQLVAEMERAAPAAVWGRDRVYSTGSRVAAT